jgi:hypothetical protein
MRFEKGLASLWNEYAKVYTERFSPENTVIVRSCDLLFRQAEVIRRLTPRLLRASATAADIERIRARLADMEATMLSFGGRTREGLLVQGHPSAGEKKQETLEFRARGENRLEGFSASQIEGFAAALNPELLQRLGYLPSYRRMFALRGIVFGESLAPALHSGVVSTHPGDRPRAALRYWDL